MDPERNADRPIGCNEGLGNAHPLQCRSRRIERPPRQRPLIDDDRDFATTHRLGIDEAIGENPKFQITR